MSSIAGLKARPFEEQVRIIELLAKRNVHLFEEIQSLFEIRSEDRVFQILVSDDRLKMLQTALLAVVAADIVTIPDKRAREPYRWRLEKLCDHFGIDERDVTKMLRHASFIENLLE
jgi:hypothetical protein